MLQIDPAKRPSAELIMQERLPPIMSLYIKKAEPDLEDSNNEEDRGHKRY